MTDYEKGSAAWDIGQILTLHKSAAAGNSFTCARVSSLQESQQQPSGKRLELALSTPCSCGAGDSPAERTSVKS